MPAGALDLAVYTSGWWLLAPELALVLGAAGLLLFEAFAAPKSGHRPAIVATAILAAALLLAIALPSAPPAGSSLVLGGAIVLDPFAQFFRIVFLIAALAGVLLARRSDEIEALNRAEYYALYLALVFGMMLLASASDVLMLMIAIEIVSIVSYVLTGFRRRVRRGSEAALKYVVYGSAASGCMFFGLSLLYGLTGHTHFSVIHEALAQGSTPMTPLAAAIAMIFVGLGYKIAAVPMHMWSPDVYEGAPTPFTAFLSTGPKAAGFAALIRFFATAFADDLANVDNMLRDVTSVPWLYLVMLVAIATMTLGNLAAIGQANIKRFLAYSSIAHAGYALAGVAAFSRSGISAVLLYLAVYILMNMGAFYIVIWVRRRTGRELIEDYRGLGHRAPALAVALTICLFSLTGLPPFAGFIGKYYVFAAVVQRGLDVGPACGAMMMAELPLLERIGCHVAGGNAFFALALIGVANSAVSLYYYARIVRKMFFEQPTDTRPIAVDWPTRAFLLPVAGALVVLGLYWAPLKSATDVATAIDRPNPDHVLRARHQPSGPAQARSGDWALTSGGNQARVPTALPREAPTR